MNYNFLFRIIMDNDYIEEKLWNDTSIPVDDPLEGWYHDDAVWQITASMIIFNMQTGFGMLESGCVSLKNEVNIMMKNVCDVILGGVTYWAFGYGLSYGESTGTSWFTAMGSWFLDESGPMQGPTFTVFLFQMSFATTATTIVSGAIAERCDFNAYCLFSLVNTVVYCVPAGWLWGNHGFLKNLGVVDIAGSGGVHLVGGTSAFVAAWLLGPRLGRWDGDTAPPMGSPTNAVIGLFMLWWGWLSFNAGSTFGISGNKWRLSAKACVTTLLASFSGGFTAMVQSYFTCDKKQDVLTIVNGILGGLVGVTASCAVVDVFEALFIGVVGSFLANITPLLLTWLKVDDAVGATCVHGFGGAWGMIAVGLFARKDVVSIGYSKYNGIIWHGETYLLGIQIFAVVVIFIWSSVSTYILLFLVDLVCPIRMAEHMELLGADYCEHEVFHPGVGVTRAVSVLQHVPKFTSKVNVELDYVGKNYGHDQYLNKVYNKEKISVFKDNPVRKAIIRAAEAVSSGLHNFKNSLSGNKPAGKTKSPESPESVSTSYLA
ncbi:putative ammonium transporter 3 [Eurytemora carolleeae]|uniref:putative ammonium transporter 3 n=1 Tax=Eurytemora carolleeae TaxID=1294199 RepID=UPI000C792A1F|nr:putative ammonium transporter 3 [Eurytemora carolleeae]|eukprot:XP_023336671.1 putative ammonium transporter 3 [Eurytemora affinis]